MKSDRHLIVFSMDSLNDTHLEIIRDLPNFKYLLDRGAVINKVESIYPTQTYPVHATIMTGVYPDKHGVFNNEKCQPGVLRQEWNWYRNSIKVKTLSEIFKESGLTVGQIFWPVMGGANVDWNIPEIWPMDREKGYLETALKCSTPEFLKEAYDKFGHLAGTSWHPGIDDFANASAAHMIRTRKPNVLFLHTAYLDHMRHKHGNQSPYIREALERYDKWLGGIIEASRDAGIFEKTTFLLIGDHGLIDNKYIVSINAEFKKQGLITVDEDNKIIDWKAYANTAGHSAQIYIKDSHDGEVCKKVEQILLDAKDNNSLGIEDVYNKEELKSLFRLDGDFEYMVEGKDDCIFTNRWYGETMIEVDKTRHNLASHGHSPLKGPQPVLIAAGAGIKSGIVIEHGKIVDEAPTMAAIMGVKLTGVDGRVIEDILE